MAGQSTLYQPPLLCRPAASCCRWGPSPPDRMERPSASVTIRRPRGFEPLPHDLRNLPVAIWFDSAPALVYHRGAGQDSNLHYLPLGESLANLRSGFSGRPLPVVDRCSLPKQVIGWFQGAFQPVHPGSQPSAHKGRTSTGLPGLSTLVWRCFPLIPRELHRVVSCLLKSHRDAARAHAPVAA